MSNFKRKPYEIEDLITRYILPQYIGEKYSALLSLLGYKTLDDLASLTQRNVENIPAFGPKRAAAVRRALRDHDRDFAPEPTLDPADLVRAAMAVGAEFDAAVNLVAKGLTEDGYPVTREEVLSCVEARLGMSPGTIGPN